MRSKVIPPKALDFSVSKDQYIPLSGDIKSVFPLDNSTPGNRDLLIWIERFYSIWKRFDRYLTQHLHVRQFKGKSIEQTEKEVIEELSQKNNFGKLKQHTSYIIMNKDWNIRRGLWVFENGAIEIMSAYDEAVKDQIIVRIASNQKIVPFKNIIVMDEDKIRFVVRIAALSLMGDTEVFHRQAKLDYRNFYLLPYSYPFIPDFWDFLYEYLRSPEPFLILGGDPGTGKSFLTGHIWAMISSEANKVLRQKIEDKEIKNFLAAISKYATNNYPSIITPDSLEILRDFILEYSSPYISLDDGAEILGARSQFDGTKIQSMVNTLLSLTGNYIFDDIKIIVTFNRHFDLDPAILRPGRTFADVKFDYLTPEQAHIFIKQYNKVFGTDYEFDFDEPVTLADVYALIRQKRRIETKRIKKRQVGFAT